jgi:hypothetical protein
MCFNHPVAHTVEYVPSCFCKDKWRSLDGTEAKWKWVLLSSSYSTPVIVVWTKLRRTLFSPYHSLSFLRYLFRYDCSMMSEIFLNIFFQHLWWISHIVLFNIPGLHNHCENSHKSTNGLSYIHIYVYIYIYIYICMYIYIHVCVCVCVSVCKTGVYHEKEYIFDWVSGHHTVWISYVCYRWHKWSLLSHSSTWILNVRPLVVRPCNLDFRAILWEMCLFLVPISFGNTLLFIINP